MVQNFALFVDAWVCLRENKNREIFNGTHTCSTRAVAIASAKIKTTKLSSKGLTSNSAKFSTSENFPLYGSTSLETKYNN